MLKTIQGEEGMSWEALGAPQRRVDVAARGVRVGEGRAVVRAARRRGWRRCIVVVFEDLIEWHRNEFCEVVVLRD
jgi:hypothetical protein